MPMVSIRVVDTFRNASFPCDIARTNRNALASTTFVLIAL
jgi:hypothetical protein